MSSGSSPAMVKESMMSDDGYTLYSDDGSIYSRSNASTDSFVSFNAYDDLPPFRLSKVDGHKNEVYEAWTIYRSSDYKMPIFARKICGWTAIEDFDTYKGTTSTISELYDQKDLMDMYLKALDKYKSKNKRTLASRLIRGTGRSYEDDIDARIRKLPISVQQEITHLLADREDVSSNRFHNRAWSVIMMQEQLHHRFADASPKIIDKKHKFRFWKNPGKNDPSEYFIIIRGREGRLVTDEKGQREFKRFENPWQRADEAEMRQKTRERYEKRGEKRAKAAPPSYRNSRASPSPPPAFPNRPVYNIPGCYARPTVGVPYYPPPGCPPPAGPPHDFGHPYPRPPPVPTPPVSYPPPPPMARCIQGIVNCAGPTYTSPAPLPPAPPGLRPLAPYSAPPVYVPQLPRVQQLNTSFQPFSPHYQRMNCGPYRNMPSYNSAPAPSLPQPAYMFSGGQYYDAPRPGIPPMHPGTGPSGPIPPPLPGFKTATDLNMSRESGAAVEDVEDVEDDVIQEVSCEGSVNGSADDDASDLGSITSAMSEAGKNESTGKPPDDAEADRQTHILNDYHLQLHLLEMLSKKRLMMAREEQDLRKNEEHDDGD